MNDAGSFGKFVPGFEFLQTLAKNAGSALPGIGQWVAPTLDPAELDKRIGELRTVQFWLEQNARMIGTTIQAIEVQRMTLATLQTMNVQMDDLREALTLKMPEAAPADAPADASSPSDEEETEPASAGSSSDESAARPAGVVDPMQWWSALTQQFSQLAAQALQDGGAGAAKTFAGAMLDPATARPRAAGSGRSAPAQSATESATKAAAKPAARRSAAKKR